MPKEKFTVLFEVQNAGNVAPPEWAEKSIKVKAGEKNAGNVLPTRTMPNPANCKMVTIEAESGEEAAQAVRSFYGAGIVNGPFLAGKVLSEVPAQP